MNVSKMGFSGNYCIRTNSSKNADILHSGFANAVERSKNIYISRDNGDIYFTTNNSQFSADDLLMMKKALATANAIFNNKYSYKKASPFSDDGAIASKIGKAFRMDAAKRGFID